jgi:hypothetical protein
MPTTEVGPLLETDSTFHGAVTSEVNYYGAPGEVDKVTFVGKYYFRYPDQKWTRITLSFRDLHVTEKTITTQSKRFR